MKIQSFQLANKLKVLLCENHKAPVVTIQSWVRTGSADEQKKQEGLSHFIEHLLFKGTKKYKVGEIAQLIEGAGGDLNAYTSFDQTVFYMTLSSEFLDFGLDAMSEMMGSPQFDPEEIDKEREVVIEEIKRTKDNPSRKSSQMLFSSLYKEHGYVRPVIGYEDVVRNTKPQDIKKLYFERYCPENMFLLIIGDFDPQEMKKKIKKNFSTLRGKLKTIKRQQEKKETKQELLIEKAPFRETYLNLAWPIFGVTKDEVVTLDALSHILSYGDNARLVQTLRIKKPLVNEIGAYQFESKDPGFFSISAQLDFKNLEESLDAIAEEILLLLIEEPSQHELSKMIIQTEESEYYQETMDALARKYGNNEFLYKDPNYFLKYLAQLKKISPQKISRTVKKFLTPENLRLTIMHPEQEASPRELILSWRSDFAQAFQDLAGQRPAKNLSQKIQKTQKPYTLTKSQEREVYITGHGTKVILAPLSNTSVIALRSGFLGGLRADILQKEGGFELLSRTWLTGTEEKSEQQISEILETKNIHMGAFSGRNSFGLTMQALNSSEKEASQIFSEVLLSATFPEEPFVREREVLSRQVQNLVDHPSALVFEDFLKSMFGDHPYSKETYGTIESLAGLKRGDVFNLYKKYVNPQNGIFVLSGGIDKSYWKDFISQMLSRSAPGKKFNEKFNLPDIKQIQKTFRQMKKEQAHIIYGFRGISLYDKEKHALQVLQTVLSGQGGRLFINLRDKASLAYSVSPVRMDGIETGYFGAYIGCSPEKSKKAIEMLKNEFDQLMQTMITSEELERAQKNIIGKQDIGLQKTTNVASQIFFDEIYGVSSLTPEKFRQEIRTVTKEDVLKLSQKLFSGYPVISVVGSESPW